MPSKRRPLPSRVYWGRRLTVVLIVSALVLGGYLLMRFSSVLAEPVAATSSQTPTATSDASPAPTPAAEKSGKKGKGKKALQVTETPQGPCDVSSLVVVPLAPESSPAQTQVTIGLSFTTTATAPCTFEVSSDSVVARITRNGTRVWSTQDCPAVISDQTIIVGPHSPGIVRLDWDGRESSPGCPAKDKYARAGHYAVQAAAYGSDAGETKFQLTPPPTDTATPTPTDTATPTGKN